MSEDETSPLYSLWKEEGLLPSARADSEDLGPLPLESLWKDVSNESVDVSDFAETSQVADFEPMAEDDFEAADFADGILAAVADGLPAESTTTPVETVVAAQPETRSYSWMRAEDQISTGKTVEELRQEVEQDLVKLRSLAADGVPPVIITPDLEQYLR